MAQNVPGKSEIASAHLQTLGDEIVVDPFLCPHPISQTCKRVLRDGRVQLVRQCVDCGRQVGGSMKHDSVASIDAIPEFDNDAWERNYQLHRAEAERKREAENSQWWAWYNGYLQSESWRRKAAKVRQRAMGFCEGCGERRATQVHHLTYEHVGAEFLWELVAVCDGCHDQAHVKK